LVLLVFGYPIDRFWGSGTSGCRDATPRGATTSTGEEHCRLGPPLGNAHADDLLAGGYEIAKDEYVRFEPEELKALEQASSSALVIDSFVPETAVDPLYFEDTYYLGPGRMASAATGS
jgi:hypothetical protein